MKSKFDKLAGNVRELENCMARAVLTADSRTLGLSPRMMNYRMNRLGLKKSPEA